MPTSSKKRPVKKVAKQQSKERKNPHHSLRLTRRRDYARELNLPSYISFTVEVSRLLWQQKRIFIPLVLIYVALYAVLVGAGSQETYSQISDSISDAGEEALGSDWGPLGMASLTLLAIASNGLNETLTESQQIFGALLGLLAWLTSVWYLRSLLANKKVGIRDALYNAGAPLIPSLLVGLVAVVQLLPIAIAAIGYSAAVSSGLLAGGVEAMLFWITAGLLAILSLYWVTSTFFALVIVTLPGMYPLRALSAARDIVLGRRVRILLRLLWMALCLAILWAVVMMPVILFDTWLKSIWEAIAWLPIVPIISLILGAMTVFWGSSYVYLLYRKVVDNDDAA